MKLKDRAIGVFDSGIGGLTVFKALRHSLPNESYIYLGDTARLPYGTKTGETVERYALQAADVLVEAGIKLLVIACNTASAFALPALQENFPDIPIIGVINSGAAAACRVTKTGKIAVISTESTAKANAYPDAIHRTMPDAEVISIACGLMVGLAEEGWTDGNIPLAVAHRYLDTVFTAPDSPDTLVLGCTHFPLLREAIQTVVGPGVTLIDSGAAAADAVAAFLKGRQLETNQTVSNIRFLATDGVERFVKVARYFLTDTVTPEMIELIDLSSTPNRADRQAPYVQKINLATRRERISTTG